MPNRYFQRLAHSVYCVTAAYYTTGLAQAAQPEVVPMAEETYHHEVFHNRYVAVYDVVLPPGAAMHYHAHSTNHLAVVIQAGSLRNEVIGRPARENSSGDAGSVIYIGAGPPHRQTNIGPAPIHFVAVEILSSSVGSRGAGVEQRAAPGAQAGCHVALEPDDVRVWQCLLPPGASAPSGERRGPFLRVPISGGVLGADFVPAAEALAAGVPGWHEPQGDLSLHNHGTARLELIDVEWK